MGFIGKALGMTSDYQADEGFLNGQTTQSADNNLQLQKMLMDQANGGGPNLADQMNKLAVQRNQSQIASILGGMKGISPAASMRAIAQAQGQAGADAAGQAALARMQQQMEAQRLLGVQSLGMTGIGAGYKAGAQNTNAQTASNNAATMGKFWGGALGGAGAAFGLGSTGGGGAAALGAPEVIPGSLGNQGVGLGLGTLKYASGGEVTANGPQSWLGQMALQMQSGGPVPGHAQVAGDSPRNDTVPAALSPGEIVLPRSVAQHPNAAQAAFDFVAALKARGGR